MGILLTANCRCQMFSTKLPPFEDRLPLLAKRHRTFPQILGVAQVAKTAAFQQQGLVVAIELAEPFSNFVAGGEIHRVHFFRPGRW